MIERVAKILEEPVCDHCLGRQFSQLLSGYSNGERGAALRKAIAMAIDSGELGHEKIDPSNFHGFRFRMAKDFRPAEAKECAVCSGFFQNIGKIAEKIAKKVEGLEFRTFLVGTTPSKALLEKEEKLWERIGIEYCEPFKAESNREIGKLLERRLRRRAELKKPDVSIIINLEDDRISVKPNPLYIFGYYKKLVRGMPQCMWGTPGKYRTSVEQIIAKPVMKMTRGMEHKFHGAGREDIDALCLDWRGFVLEIVSPKKRSIDLGAVERAVNKTGKVEVKGLKISDMETVRRIKAAANDKTYRLLVLLDKPVKKGDLSKLSKLKGEIMQQTPERVLHRRADLTRKRVVKAISWKQLGPKKIEVIVKGTAGLYVKELVSGDRGRTRPSVAEILGVPAKVKYLDVIEIGK
ncbi:MAG: tRNA pseudouridine(54/55) synthase Pus10 [Candidatus Aenigmatarchaeota archaeon]